ncbi:methyltransferase domain-containing protein [Candidatus Aminicenantes bacterium AC-334-K16]|jgi:ubiquinone/menaquinone biosynthesis C-methylase UbiE|nr:methyltransferase domain-containing protein [Candidatus Aminicenantes bacterium AC-334-K16]
MDNKKAIMFNRLAADPKSKPDEILKALNLRRGQFVADIGAGGGYFSLRMAELVGSEGKIFAVDANPDFLHYIEQQAQEKGLNNLVLVQATSERPNLPSLQLDLIFMRNVTHHLPHRQEYLKKLTEFLKPEGRVAIIEYKKGKLFSFHRLFGHYIPKEKLIQEMREAGYQLEQDFDFLPRQHFTIYKPARLPEVNSQ